MTVKRTSSFVSRVIAISLLLIAVTTVSAQSRKEAIAEKSAKAEKDSVAFFRGVAVSADVVGLTQLAFSDYGQYEAALRINLKDRYFPVFELGYGTTDADNPTTNLRYKTSAPYWRVGADFNIAKNKHDAYRVYAGARYAMTYYKFDVSGNGLKDPVWGDDITYNIKGMKATIIGWSSVRCRCKDCRSVPIGLVGALPQTHSTQRRQDWQHLVCSGLRKTRQKPFGWHVQHHL